MSDKLQLVASIFDKLKFVGHEKARVLGSRLFAFAI